MAQGTKCSIKWEESSPAHMLMRTVKLGYDNKREESSWDGNVRVCFKYRKRRAIRRTEGKVRHPEEKKRTKTGN